MTQRKRKTKPKPPPVVADLFDVPDVPVSLSTPPPGGAAPETPPSASSAANGERGAAGREREAVSDYAATVSALERVKSLAVREVRSFPAALVGELPDAFTLRCELEGVPFVFTSSRAAYAEAREGGIPVFVMRELEALAHAAQNGAAPQYVFAAVLARKRDEPSFVVSPRYLFGGPPASADASTWPVGEALDEMGAVLAAVDGVAA